MNDLIKVKDINRNLEIYFWTGVEDKNNKWHTEIYPVLKIPPKTKYYLTMQKKYFNNDGNLKKDYYRYGDDYRKDIKDIFSMFGILYKLDIMPDRYIPKIRKMFNFRTKYGVKPKEFIMYQMTIQECSIQILENFLRKDYHYVKNRIDNPIVSRAKERFSLLNDNFWFTLQCSIYSAITFLSDMRKEITSDGMEYEKAIEDMYENVMFKFWKYETVPDK